MKISKLNKAMIMFMAIVTLVFVGLYVGDYFWVESYKSVPVYYQHIFGNDLTRYIIYDHIICGIFTFLVIVVLNLTIYVEFKKK